MINRFLWKGHRPKIGLSKIMRDKNEGGLSLFNLEQKYIALKVQWINVYYNNEEIRELAHQLLTCEYGEYTWQALLTERDVTLLFKESFWSEVLIAWCKCRMLKPHCKARVLDMNIWLNSEIRIGNRPVYNRRAIENNFVKVSCLINKTIVISKSFRPHIVHVYKQSIKGQALLSHLIGQGGSCMDKM